MIFGLTWEKLILIGVLAAVLIGPERLPRLAESFAKIVHRLGGYVRDARTWVRDEVGEEMDDVDWKKLDPRQYDPRRIIRDALLDETPTAAAAAATPVYAPPAQFSDDAPPPYDDEAT